MLSKLIKYEFKATSRTLVPLYLVLLFISVINRFLVQSGVESGVLGFFTGILMFTQIMLIIGIAIASLIIMIIRFYKNLLSDEGYLMFTLPVKSHQLITSKLIITMFWMFISCIAIVLSLFIVFANSSNIGMFINEVQRAIVEISTVFGGAAFIGFIIFAILSIVSSILLIYVSIAIGQLFSKHKVIASFVSYAVLYNVVQVLMVAVLVVLGFATNDNIFAQNILPKTFLPIIIVVTFVISAIFYIVTDYIFKRKLNLD